METYGYRQDSFVVGDDGDVDMELQPALVTRANTERNDLRFDILHMVFSRDWKIFKEMVTQDRQ